MIPFRRAIDRKTLISAFVTHCFDGGYAMNQKDDRESKPPDPDSFERIAIEVWEGEGGRTLEDLETSNASELNPYRWQS